METIVAKIGGTSNSDAEAVNHSMEINAEALGVVVSAPGSLNESQLGQFGEVEVDPAKLQRKVTITLKAMRADYETNGQYLEEDMRVLQLRYGNIYSGLGLVSQLGSDWVEQLAPRVDNAVKTGREQASIVGEQIMADIYAKRGRSVFDPGRSNITLGGNRDNWRQFYFSDGRDLGALVLPGNITFDGRSTREFDQGGSDISGALLAYAMRADEYHNMSDSPLYSFDRRILRDAVHVPNLTYSEGRELGRNGTGLLHPVAMTVLAGSGIPTIVRDTFNPDSESTTYSDEILDRVRIGKVVAMSLMDVDVIKVHESGMLDSHGRVRDFADAIDAKGVNINHIGEFGSDGLLLVVNPGSTEEDDGIKTETVLRDLVNGNGTVTREELSLITAVGYDIHPQALEINLALRDALAAYNNGRTYRFESQHAVRNTVDRKYNEEALEAAHAALIG